MKIRSSFVANSSSSSFIVENNSDIERTILEIVFDKAKINIDKCTTCQILTNIVNQLDNYELTNDVEPHEKIIVDVGHHSGLYDLFRNNFSDDIDEEYFYKCRTVTIGRD